MSSLKSFAFILASAMRRARLVLRLFPVLSRHYREENRYKNSYKNRYPDGCGHGAASYEQFIPLKAITFGRKDPL